MNNGSFVASSTIHKLLTAALFAVVLVLVWSTTAHAQQYDPPTESGENAINSVLDPGAVDPSSTGATGTSTLTAVDPGDPTGTGTAGASGTSALNAAAGTSASSGSTGLTGLLPSTGGPLLPLLLLGGLALSSAGLLLARRNSR